MRHDLPTGTVTFFFTDVGGSTWLLEELGAETYADALSRHRDVVRSSLAAHGDVSFLERALEPAGANGYA